MFTDVKCKRLKIILSTCMGTCAAGLVSNMMSQYDAHYFTLFINIMKENARHSDS